MSASHKSENSEKTEKATHHRSSKNDSKFKLLILVMLVVIAGVLIALQASSSSDKKSNTTTTTITTTPTTPKGNAKLYIKSSTNNIASGSSVTFEIWVDTANQPVNAVQANLTYPADKFDFNAIDGKGSAFEVQAMSKGGSGEISIARGHVGDIKGQALLAKVVLVAKNKGDASLNFASGSAVVRSTDHINILKDKTNSSFKISKNRSSIAIALIKST
jgi:hypothetical protein